MKSERERERDPRGFLLWKLQREGHVREEKRPIPAKIGQDPPPLSLSLSLSYASKSETTVSFSNTPQFSLSVKRNAMCT